MMKLIHGDAWAYCSAFEVGNIQICTGDHKTTKVRFEDLDPEFQEQINLICDPHERCQEHTYPLNLMVSSEFLQDFTNLAMMRHLPRTPPITQEEIHGWKETYQQLCKLNIDEVKDRREVTIEREDIPYFDYFTSLTMDEMIHQSKNEKSWINKWLMEYFLFKLVRPIRKLYNSMNF